MLVVSTRKALVIDTNIRDKVLSAIPHARTIKVEGKPMVAVPHGIDECLVLRNLGFREVPSPILSYYKWPGRYPPMVHQRTTAAFMTGHRRALVLSAPGTGKTASAAWAADFLMKAGMIKRVLVVCPLSIVRTVWAKELKTFVPHRQFEIILGNADRRRELLHRPGLEFAIINHDGVKVIREWMDMFDLVIYDEATALKNPSTDRFRIFNSWVQQKSPWLWVMTGTPFSQTPVDAWALAKVVNSPTLTKSYTGFKELVMNKVGMFRWVPRTNALETCKQVLQPSIRFELDECVDLPATVFVERQTSLSVAQAAAFKEMKEKAVLAAHDITAVNAAVVMQKLIQIICGVVYDGAGDRHKIDAAQRLEDLKELIEEAGDKVVIYVPLRGVQDWLAEELGKDYSVASVHGGVGLRERGKIFDAFQNTASPQVLLAHPKVAAHGLTLTASKTVIWYAPIHSLEQYEQGNARIRRIGTEGKTRVVHLYATNFERELYSRLKHKKRVLEDFLDLVNGVNYGD
jgi:SNF2 family DNA or RNA helicase